MIRMQMIWQSIVQLFSFRTISINQGFFRAIYQSIVQCRRIILFMINNYFDSFHCQIFSKMASRLCLVILFVTLIGALNGQKEPLQDEDACCRLEWKQVKEGEGLPSDAILGNKYIDQKKYAYSWSSMEEKEGTLTFIALKSEDPAEEPLYFGEYSVLQFMSKVFLATAGSSKYPIKVLSNPNNCDIDWLKTHQSRQNVNFTADATKSWPNVSGDLFAKFADIYTGSYGPGFGLLYFDWQKKKNFYPGPGKFPIELLYVKCPKP